MNTGNHRNPEQFVERQKAKYRSQCRVWPANHYLTASKRERRRAGEWDRLEQDTGLETRKCGLAYRLPPTPARHIAGVQATVLPLSALSTTNHKQRLGVYTPVAPGLPVIPLRVGRGHI